MLLRLLTISTLIIKTSANYPQLMCYECSRGSLHGKQLLIDDYFDLDYDESAQRAISHEHEDCGSNTTFLGLSIRLKLQSVPFFIREEFSQAKTGFDCVWILSDVLDRTYRVYCPRLCQITYLLNDPYLTVIASCQSGSWTGIVYDNQFALSTCSEDLCNSFALNQKGTPSSFATTDITRKHLLILICLIVTSILAVLS